MSKFSYNLNIIKTFLIGLLLSSIIFFISDQLLKFILFNEFLSNLYKTNNNIIDVIIAISLLLSIVLVSFIFLKIKLFLTLYVLSLGHFSGHKQNNSNDESIPLLDYGNILTDICILILILFITLFIPTVIVFWLINPQDTKKGILIIVFFVSIIFSISYYLINKDKFKTVSETIGYFAGVILGPITVIEILF